MSQILETLQQAAIIQNTESLNRIERVEAPLQRIKALVAQKTTPMNCSEQEMLGIAMCSTPFMLTNGQCDAMTLDWSKLHYQHTAALNAVFRDKYAPATANRMLSALRRVLKEARRLKLMDTLN